MPDSTRLLFISRAAADHEFAAKIARDLEAAGYQTLLQQWDFANRSFIERMHSALANGARVIALLSPEYLQSEYCSAEWQSVLAHDPLNRNSRLLVLRVTACTPTGFLAPLGYWDLVPIADQPESVRDVVLAAVKKGRRRDEGTSETPYWRPPQTILHRSIRPGHGLVDRPALLTAIESALRSSEHDASHAGAICALTGLPGVGKTVVAREFAHLNKDRYAGVWWIDASVSSSLVEGLVALGSHFVRGLQDVANQEEAARTTLQLIEDGQFARPWLLVFDDADSPDAVSDFLPRSGADVVITSQWADWHEWAVEITADVLDRDSSTALLLGRAHRDKEDAPSAGRLAEALGDLPLGLNNAAAYCRATGITFEEYQNELLHLITKEPESTRYRDSVSSALQLALSRAKNRCPFASLAVSLLACLSPDRIPLELLHTAFEQMAERDDIREAVAALATFSLIEVTESTQGTVEISVHRLVQQVMVLQLKNQGFEDQAVGLTSVVLAKAFPHSSEAMPDQDPRNPATWPACARLLPHALAVLGRPSGIPATTGPRSFLMHHAGLYLHARGLYATAEPLLRTALSLKEAAVGAEDGRLLPDLRRLGMLLLDRGKLSEAQKLLEQSLALAQRELGAEHPETGTDLNNLGSVLERRGEFAEAESLYRRAVDLTEAEYGRNHERFRSRLSNLVLLLHRLHRTEEVEEILREDSGQRDAQESLSAVLASSGHLTEAEQLLRQSLAEHERELGLGHPEVARDLSNLSVVLEQTGRFEEAEAALRRALEIEEQTIGADHPRVAVRLSNLATLYANTGQPYLAARACLRALGILDGINEADRGPEVEEMSERLQAIMLSVIKKPLLETLGLEGLVSITLVGNPEDARRQIDKNIEELESKREGESIAQEDLGASEGHPEAPLLAAASRGDDEAVRAFLNNRSNVHVQTSRGYTALHLAAREGHTEVVRMLLFAGADVHTGSRTTPLHLAAARGEEASARMLIDYGANVDARTDEGASTLHFAALEGRSAMLVALLSAGADIEARDQDGWTPLLFASAAGADEAVQTLLASGADPFASDNDGFLALHLAAKEGHAGIVEALLDTGVDVDTPIPTGHSALHLAAEGGHEATVSCLITKGARLGAQTSAGTTPLHFSAFNGHSGVVAMLLAAGAEITARTLAGYTPLDLAANRNHAPVVQLLLEAGGAAVDQTDQVR
jgi:ankyrin repeat protein/Flp pilus assembly protein TadD